MICEELDLDLLGHLGFHSCLFNIFLVDHLDRQGKARPKVSCHIHVSEPSLSQLPAYFELSQGQLFSFPGDQHGAEVQKRLIGAISMVLSTRVFGSV